MESTISLVVLSYKNWHVTEQCLQSLVASLDQALIDRGVEIVLVDNGSDEETREGIIAYRNAYDHENVTLECVMLEENLGYPAGINVGLEHARGRLIAVLNNDLVFPPGWLTPLVNVLEKDKLVAFAAPFLSYAGSIQNVPGEYTNFDEMVQFANNFMTANAEKVIVTDKVIGACMVFRRDFLELIGGNDYWYGVGNYDDDDWCLRARIAGYKIVIVGASYVQHVGHATYQLNPENFHVSMGSNIHKFERKWDIREQVNGNGTYTRLGVLKHTRYDRSKHYIPLALGDFSLSQEPFLPRKGTAKRLFLCADWTSSLSSWKQDLEKLLPAISQIELMFWIPTTHFDVEAVAKEIQQVFSQVLPQLHERSISLTLFQEEIPYVEVLRLLRSADILLQFKNDFVNRYMVRLARQIEMAIAGI